MKTRMLAKLTAAALVCAALPGLALTAKAPVLPHHAERLTVIEKQPAAQSPRRMDGPVRPRTEQWI